MFPRSLDWGRGSWVSIWADAYLRPWKTEERLVASMLWYSARGLDQIGWGLGIPERGRGVLVLFFLG